jgi:hypothetical protein
MYCMQINIIPNINEVGEQLRTGSRPKLQLTPSEYDCARGQDQRLNSNTRRCVDFRLRKRRVKCILYVRVYI